LRPQGIERVDVRKIVMSFFDRHLRKLDREGADARYAALLAYEKEHPVRTKAREWRLWWVKREKAKKIASDGTSFVMTHGKTDLKITIDPTCTYVLEHPGTVEEVKLGSLVRLRGSKPEGAEPFRVTSIQSYPSDHRGGQFAHDKRIDGRWYGKGDPMQVGVAGKKQPIVLDADVRVGIRKLAGPDALKAGLEIVEIWGKKIGSDHYASRIAIGAGQ